MRAVRPMTSETREPTPTRSQNAKRHSRLWRGGANANLGRWFRGSTAQRISSARCPADRRARLLDYLGLLSAFGEQIERFNARWYTLESREQIGRSGNEPGIASVVSSSRPRTSMCSVEPLTSAISRSPA
jgi:hypothetical protein